MTRVGISAVAAVRGDFQRLFVDDHGERAVRGSGLVGAIALPFENALHVLPVSLRGDVDIGGRPPEQRVADVSAHYPRLEAGVFERIEGASVRCGKGMTTVGSRSGWFGMAQAPSFASYTNISERSS